MVVKGEGERERGMGDKGRVAPATAPAVFVPPCTHSYPGARSSPLPVCLFVPHALPESYQQV